MMQMMRRRGLEGIVEDIFNKEGTDNAEDNTKMVESGDNEQW